MILPYHEQLNTSYLQRLFDNMSECYKLFWFQAVVDQVRLGNTTLSYEDLIDDMIADAWYMVTEYRLNLGPFDNLEAVVHYAQNLLNLKSSEKKTVIIDALKSCTDDGLIKKKTILTYNVPYRLQAPFMQMMGNDWSGKKQDLAKRINGHEGLIYRFDNIAGLRSTITIDPLWAEYIRSNYEIIKGWIQYNMIQYIQRRNPSVPGIPNKLEPPQERKLTKVKAYWDSVLSVQPIHEIYGGNEIVEGPFSIDHFIPWSYVAHDELWNLHPTTRSINSSKSNNLPDWDTYFSKLCKLEYHAYDLMWRYEPIHAAFEKCAADHVNSIDVRQRLYKQGLSEAEFASQLIEIVYPVYKAALSLGFGRWAL